MTLLAKVLLGVFAVGSGGAVAFGGYISSKSSNSKSELSRSETSEDRNNLKDTQVGKPGAEEQEKTTNDHSPKSITEKPEVGEVNIGKGPDNQLSSIS